jgi:uncharacterized membrane protein
MASIDGASHTFPAGSITFKAILKETGHSGWIEVGLFGTLVHRIVVLVVVGVVSRNS